MRVEELDYTVEHHNPFSDSNRLLGLIKLVFLIAFVLGLLAFFGPKYFPDSVHLQEINAQVMAVLNMLP